MKKFLLSAAFFYCINFSFAQSGHLDPSFATGGIAATDMGSVANIYNTTSRQVLIDSGGSMYVLLNSAFISKRLPNGSIDSSYGFNGYSKSVFLTNAFAALQKDGKIVIVGTQQNSSTFIVTRVNANGIPDSAFGINGVQTTAFAGIAVARSVTVANDGTIGVAGYVSDANGSYFAIALYNKDGSPATGFNGSGHVTTDFSFKILPDNGTDSVDTHNSFANTILIQPDGKVVAAGNAQASSGINFAIARYNKNGSLDKTFGTTGMQTTNFGSGNDNGFSLALQKSGKIILAGYILAGAYNKFAVACYNANGSADNTFNGNGRQTIAIGSDAQISNSVALQSNGKIVIAGYTLNGDLNNFAVARLDTTGTLDNTFNTTGTLTTDINSSDDYAGSVAIQNDDKIVVAGYALNSNGISAFALTRYNNNGTPDNTFGTGGKLEGSYKQGYTRFNTTAIQTDGKAVAAGLTWNGSDYDFAIARYNINGSPDSSFNFNGKQTVNFGIADEAISVAIQANGKIVVAGNTGDVNGKYAVARFNSDGSPDNSFSDDGKLIISMGFADVLRSVILQPDGKIVLSGYTFTDTNYDSSFFALTRIDSTGKIDNTFNGTGKQLTEFYASPSFAASAALQSDGKIIVAGRAFINNNDNFCLARYNIDGTLDTTFSHDGKQNNAFSADGYFGQSVAIQNDQKIILAGYRENSSGTTSSFTVARYLTNGDLDNSFASNGFQTADLGEHWDIARSVAIIGDGRIAIAGTNDNYAIVLYKSNGTRDSTFGDNGIQITNIGLGNSDIQSLAFANNKLYAAGSANFPGVFGVVARYLLATGGPLPVSLTNFTAVLKNKTVLLQWQTVSEQNVAGFMVERSTDGSTFSSIGYVTAKGNSNLKLDYSIIDNQPLHGVSYYRLKIIDIDGRFVYSKTVPIIINDAFFTIKISPNPAKNLLKVQANGFNEQAVYVITDATGKKLLQAKVSLLGDTLFSIDINNLANGTYTLQLQTAATITTKRFIKE